MSISLLLCDMSNVPQGNSTGVAKIIVMGNLYAKIINSTRFIVSLQQICFLLLYLR